MHDGTWTICFANRSSLETASLYVAGSNGGSYKVSWTVWKSKGGVLHKGQETGVIKEEPTAYPINLEGFRSGQCAVLCDDIEVEARKAEAWQGDLVIVLKANGAIVECATTDATYPRDDPGGADLYFEADDREEYMEDSGCESDLEK